MLAQTSLPALVARALLCPDNIAIVDYTQRADHPSTTTYSDLLECSARGAAALLGDRHRLAGERIAIHVAPGADWVISQWAIFRAGGVAVPLSLRSPLEELKPVLAQCQPTTVIADPRCLHSASLREEALLHGTRLMAPAELVQAELKKLPEIAPNDAAMLVFSSGTTAGPKGIMLSHSNIRHQVEPFVKALHWGPQDTFVSTLPLSHMNGINNIQCSLWSGGRCLMLPNPPLSLDLVSEALLDGSTTLFIAVPTLYEMLLKKWEQMLADNRHFLTRLKEHLRLAYSGSDALTARIRAQWTELTGLPLYQGAGASEFGRLFYQPPGDYREGSVGIPLSSFQVKLVGLNGEVIRDANGAVYHEGTPGRLYVRGPAVFLGYFNDTDLTEASFDDGWFVSEDLYRVEAGHFYFVGRASSDAVKIAGSFVFTPEVTEILRTHPDVVDCLVLAIQTSGQEPVKSLGAVVQLRPGALLTAAELTEWARQRMSRHKIPTRWVFVEECERTDVGKIRKAWAEDLLRRQESST